jgi:hypothetical protein
MKKITQYSLLLLLVALFSFTPEQLLKTKMTIDVIDGLGKHIEGADVKLYKTIDDFNNNKNQVQVTKQTNEKGIVKFTKLDAISYYIQVEKGTLSNMFTAEKTKALVPKKANKLIIIIE